MCFFFKRKKELDQLINGPEIFTVNRKPIEVPPLPRATSKQLLPPQECDELLGAYFLGKYLYEIAQGIDFSEEEEAVLSAIGPRPF